MKLIPKLVLCFFLLLLIVHSSIAQNQDREWNFEIGLGAVDVINSKNVGDIFKDMLTSGDYVDNISPARFAAEKIMSNLTSFQLSVSLHTVKTIEAINDSDVSYFAIDASYKRYLDNIIPLNWFRPYLLAGVGYQRLVNTDFVIHAGGGAQFWFSDTLGITFQTLFKDDFQLTGAGNFQHFLGIVIKTIPGGSRSTKRVWEFKN